MSPYQRILSVQRRRRPWHIPFLIVCSLSIAGWIARPSLFYFLEHSDIARGLGGFLFRICALSVAVISIVVYVRLMRDNEREVLSLHPIHPKKYLRALIGDVFFRTWWLPVGLMGFTTPLLTRDLLSWLVCTGLCVSTWIGSIGASFAISLGAVWASTSKSCHPLLDALRGSNPREQAAFIYAPGFSLFLLGVVLMLSVEGGLRVLSGGGLYSLFLLLPSVFGVIGFKMALSLAPTQLVRATAILHEIDSRWGHVDAESGRHDTHVYLDWLAKRSPERLRALRQGWRIRRSLVMFPWGFGVFSALALWSDGQATAIGLAQIGVIIAGASAGAFRDGDPNWLNMAIGVKSNSVLRARFEVGLLYTLGSLLPLGFASLVLQPPSILTSYAGCCVLALFCCAASTSIAALTRRPVLPRYGIAAILSWSLIGVFL